MQQYVDQILLTLDIVESHHKYRIHLYLDSYRKTPQTQTIVCMYVERIGLKDWALIALVKQRRFESFWVSLLD